MTGSTQPPPSMVARYAMRTSSSDFAVPGRIPGSRGYNRGLQRAPVANDVAVARAQIGVPARARAARVARRVEPKARDDRVGVAAVRIDRDPLARAARAPALEVAGRHRRVQEPCAVERVGDGAR